MTSFSPWVSFCISTYKRPEILQRQLLLLSQQTFRDFEAVVSDNDPDASARKIIEKLNDPRFKYFHNNENLGMIRSFNKSIERSSADFIVMVTDDDPVDYDFLDTFHELYKKHPSYSIYGGFRREDKAYASVEFILKDEFIEEILHPLKTSNLLWSSSIIRKADAVKIGLIPDYEGTHLADHAFIAMAGSINGGVVMNKMFSRLSSHDSNFSKSNFEQYTKACEGFYRFMMSALTGHKKIRQYEDILIKHLNKWFISNIFSLKKYYTIAKKDDLVKKVEDCASEILKFPFMNKIRAKYFAKTVFFSIKKKLGVLR
jgi:glycosyltransferase involved in cell wall biosynthesis